MKFTGSVVEKFISIFCLLSFSSYRGFIIAYSQIRVVASFQVRSMLRCPHVSNWYSKFSEIDRERESWKNCN